MHFFCIFCKKNRIYGINGVRAYVLCLCEYIHITLKIGLHMRKWEKNGVRACFLNISKVFRYQSDAAFIKYIVGSEHIFWLIMSKGAGAHSYAVFTGKIKYESTALKEKIGRTQKNITPRSRIYWKKTWGQSINYLRSQQKQRYLQKI